MAALALLAVTVALNMQDGGIKTLSQDVNLFIYLSLLRYCQKANVNVGEIQYLTISTMWDFIGLLLLLRLPPGTKDTRARSGATGHRSPASLKSISWRLTEGKGKQPGSIAHSFQRASSPSILQDFSPCQCLEGRKTGLR